MVCHTDGDGDRINADGINGNGINGTGGDGIHDDSKDGNGTDGDGIGGYGTDGDGTDGYGLPSVFRCDLVFAAVFTLSLERINTSIFRNKTCYLFGHLSLAPFLPKILPHIL